MEQSWNKLELSFKELHPKVYNKNKITKGSTEILDHYIEEGFNDSQLFYTVCMFLYHSV